MAGDVHSPSSPWLVIGLGNPGDQHARNRHNIGFVVVEALADRMGSRFKAHKTYSDVVEGHISGRRVVLAKPRTFMNESGRAAAALRGFFDVPADRIVVVHDDLDLGFGVLRLKRGGGDNGHNGLRSITKSLATNDYLRVRCGIGRPPGRMDPADFVLRDFSVREREDLGVVVETAADAAQMLLNDSLLDAQNRFHAPIS